MSIDKTWGEFFKPEIKTSGSKLFSQEKISIAGGSDTAIQAYVRVAPPFKVHFSSTDITSESFTADCSCPVAKKGRFCKHIWATLLSVEQKYPDFLSSKRIIEKPDTYSDTQSGAQNSFQVSAKLRAAEYRKDQYQKQKLRAKELKKTSRMRQTAQEPTFPPHVAASIAYFTENGFPMPEGPSEEVLGEAKRKLSRVFHPDRGGSHEEIIELNRNCELLIEFLRL